MRIIQIAFNGLEKWGLWCGSLEALGRQSEAVNRREGSRFGNYSKVLVTRCCGKHLKSLKIKFSRFTQARVIASSNRRYIFSLDITRGLHKRMNSSISHGTDAVQLPAFGAGVFGNAVGLWARDTTGVWLGKRGGTFASGL